jgi:activator of HSP90 ATPase
LTIYDLEVEAVWVGKDSNGEEVKGTLKVPEVSHEAIDGLSDYVVSAKSLIYKTFIDD